MIVIHNLANDIKDTIKDAEKYLDRAIELKEEYPKLSETYMQISQDHEKEIPILHAQATDIIKITKSGDVKPEILAVMSKVWEFEHDELMERWDSLERKKQRFLNLNKR